MMIPIITHPSPPSRKSAAYYRDTVFSVYKQHDVQNVHASLYVNCFLDYDVYSSLAQVSLTRYLLRLFYSFINVINEYISSAINKITNSFFTHFVFRHIDRTLAKAGRSKLIFGQ